MYINVVEGVIFCLFLGAPFFFLQKSMGWGGGGREGVHTQARAYNYETNWGVNIWEREREFTYTT